jgi:hypothetical protein
VINNNDFVENMFKASRLGRSDHLVLIIKSFTPGEKEQTIQKDGYGKGDYTSLIKSFDVSWDTEIGGLPENIEQTWNKFEEIIFQNVQRFALERIFFAALKNKNWEQPLSK